MVLLADVRSVGVQGDWRTYGHPIVLRPVSSEDAMTADWFDTDLQTIGMYLDGRGIRHRDERGRPVHDESYLVWLHAGAEPVTVHLPGAPWSDGYEFVVSTEYRTGAPPRPAVVAPGPIELPSRTVWLLRVLRRP